MGRSSRGTAHGQSSVLFLARFFTATLASQRFLDSLLLAWLQIKRVPLDFLDDVFLLHLALEPA